MKRRVALKNLALTFGDLVALPVWADGWNEASIKHVRYLSSAKEEMLLA